MKTLITIEELKESNPIKPKFYGFKSWISRYLSMLIIVLIDYSVFILLLHNNLSILPKEFFKIFGSLGLILPLMLSMIPMSFKIFDKLFGIYKTKQAIDEWEQLYTEYLKQQKYLSLKKEYEDV